MELFEWFMLPEYKEFVEVFNMIWDCSFIVNDSSWN